MEANIFVVQLPNKVESVIRQSIDNTLVLGHISGKYMYNINEYLSIISIIAIPYILN